MNENKLKIMAELKKAGVIWDKGIIRPANEMNPQAPVGHNGYKYMQVSVDNNSKKFWDFYKINKEEIKTALQILPIRVGRNKKH